jgi:hypothetical protein
MEIPGCSSEVLSQLPNTSSNRPQESISNSSETSKRQKTNDSSNSNQYASFLEGKWTLISETSLYHPPELSLLKRSNEGITPIQMFLKFLPLSLWTILVTTVNRNLSQTQSSASSKRHSTKAVTVQQLIQFYGILIYIENTYGNDNTLLRSHFNAVRSRFGKIKGLGVDRFEALWRAFNPSIGELKAICDILHQTFTSFVESVHLCTVDEEVIGYQPSTHTKQVAEQRGEPIPVVYIPRKPHPNGLENFLLVTPVAHPAKQEKGLPYILDIYPHLTQNDAAPQSVVELFATRWKHEEKPHIIGDSAFGSFELLDKLERQGIQATFSMSLNTSTFLWKLLSQNVPPDHWRAAVNEKKWITSSHTIIDKNNARAYQQVLSNGFKSTIATSTTITTTSNSFNTSTPSIPSTSSTLSTITLPSSTSIMPVFTEAMLQKMKAVQLKEICRKYNIKQGKNKATMIHNIVTRSNTIHTQAHDIESLEKAIASQWLSDPAPLHNFYRSWFNLIDLVDKKWYSVEQHHQIQNWKSKIIQSILRLAVMNAWVFFTQSQFTKWKEFRLILAAACMKCNFI